MMFGVTIEPIKTFLMACLGAVEVLFILFVIDRIWRRIK